MINPFQILPVDTWYKGMLVISGCVLLASLFFKIEAADQISIQLLALGGVLLGLGELAFHPRQLEIRPPIAVTVIPRRFSIFGLMLDGAAVFVFAKAFLRMLG